LNIGFENWLARVERASKPPSQRGSIESVKRQASALPPREHLGEAITLIPNWKSHLVFWPSLQWSHCRSARSTLQKHGGLSDPSPNTM